MGETVRIADVRSTQEWHFLPGRPGNTGTVSAVNEFGDYFIDLHDNTEDHRLDAGQLTGWPFAHFELEKI